MTSTKYFCVALCSNEPDALPHYEFCECGHSSLERARECWYARPAEFRATVQAFCHAHNCRVVVWENEVIDKLHSIADA
jgi:hypothetical protein